MKKVNDIKRVVKKHAVSAGKHVKKGTIQLRDKTAKVSKKVSKDVNKQVKKVQGMDSKKISKKIDKNIAKTGRLWDNISVVLFNKVALKNLSHFSSIGLGLFAMFFTALVLVFPTKLSELNLVYIMINFLMVLAMLVISVCAMWGVAKLLGSKTKFRPFFFVVNTSIFMSLLSFTIPIALVAFAIFATMLRSDSAISMFFTFLPFYNYLIWGWSAETVADLKGVRSIALGVLCLLWIMLSHLGLQFIML